MSIKDRVDLLYASRSACPICGDEVRILLHYDLKFSVACGHGCKEWVLPTPMEMCERFPLRPRMKSMRQAVKDWNKLAEIESWRIRYWDNDGENYRDLDRKDDGTPIDEIGRYEVVFDFNDTRFYCFIDAINIDEAMSSFWKNHRGITMKHIVETLEI